MESKVIGEIEASDFDLKEAIAYADTHCFEKGPEHVVWNICVRDYLAGVEAERKRWRTWAEKVRTYLECVDHAIPPHEEEYLLEQAKKLWGCDR